MGLLWQGFDPSLIVVVFVLIVFGGVLGVNCILYSRAQRYVDPKPKKRVSKKKLQRERIKQGMPAPE